MLSRQQAIPLVNKSDKCTSEVQKRQDLNIDIELAPPLSYREHQPSLEMAKNLEIQRSKVLKRL